jgi:hypothetical protein
MANKIKDIRPGSRIKLNVLDKSGVRINITAAIQFKCTSNLKDAETFCVHYLDSSIICIGDAIGTRPQSYSEGVYHRRAYLCVKENSMGFGGDICTALANASLAPSNQSR